MKNNMNENLPIIQIEDEKRLSVSDIAFIMVKYAFLLALFAWILAFYRFSFAQEITIDNSLEGEAIIYESETLTTEVIASSTPVKLLPVYEIIGKEALPAPDEIIEERTTRSQTFDKKDGTYSMRVYFDDQFVKVGETWKSIEATTTIPKVSFFSPRVVWAETSVISKDTWLASLYPNNNTDGGGVWYVGRSGNGYSRTLLTTTLPAGSGPITSKKLFVRVTGYRGAYDIYEHSVYSLDRDNWVENQATWNIWQSGSSWTTAGGDFSTLYSSLSPRQSVGWEEYDVTDDPAVWGETISLMFKRTEENNTSNYESEYAGRDYATSDYRPYIEVIYIPEATSTSTATSTATSTDDTVIAVAYGFSFIIFVLGVLFIPWMFGPVLRRKNV